MNSLNKVYEDKELFYYCNACGEINIPNTDPLSYHETDELPLKERNLYENYWSDDICGCMYVVNYKGNPAMAICFLFCECYLCDIFGKSTVTEEDMSVFYDAVCDYAKMLEKEEAVSFCDVLVGKDTDPDGHELLVIIPYERRSKIKEIASYLDKVVYSTVENLL